MYGIFKIFENAIINGFDNTRIKIFPNNKAINNVYTRSGALNISIGPGCSPCITKAPNSIAVVAPPGIPREIIGIMVPIAANGYNTPKEIVDNYITLFPGLHNTPNYPSTL